MKITSSDISLSATHFASERTEIRDTVRVRGGNDQGASVRAAAAQMQQASVQISEAGTAASKAASAVEEAKEAAENDPKTQLIKNLIEFLTGEKITLVRASEIAGQAEAEAGAGDGQPSGQAAAPVGGQGAPAPAEIERRRTVSHSESEQTSFRASGVVRTADNQEIKFDLSLTMSRSYYEESTTVSTSGGRKATDPLVLNFSGKAAELTDQRFDFDLNADGKTENIQFVQGSGFLALDKNGDGAVNDGSELFGPTSGDGFSELAALDGDSNGWIDENDSVYGQLMVWTKDASGADQVRSLKEANVGAIAVGNVATPFQMKDSANQLLAQVRASGVWLSEQGKAGTMQQIDLVA